jgi:hypothetical protein
MNSAARPAMAITGPFRLPASMIGIAEQSTTRRPSTPLTLSRSSTTSPSLGPVAQLPTVAGVPAIQCGVDQFVVGLRVLTREHLVVDAVGNGRLREQLSRSANQIGGRGAVVIAGEVVRFDA